MMPKVSIIVPVYNVERYLERCAASIFGQTFQDFEVIFVNDGSTDNSSVLLEQYRDDPRVTILAQPNQGLSCARNRGMCYAKGEYIYFCDSDDRMHPQLLEVVLYAMEREHAELASFHFFRNTGEAVTPRALVKETLPYEVNEDPYCLGGQNVLAWAKLFKRTLLDGIRFIPGIKYEDVPFIFDVVKRRPRTVILPEPLYYWMTNDTSITHAKASPQQIYSYHLGLRHICDAYKVPGYEAAWKFIREQAIPNLLKQQLNLCRRADKAVRPAMFDAFAAELAELQQRGALLRHGHKLFRYLRYYFLMRCFQRKHSVK